MSVWRMSLLVIIVRCVLLLLLVDVDQNSGGVKQIYNVRDGKIEVVISL